MKPSQRWVGTLIRRFAKVRLLVVGDLMLDQFIWGRVDRISPEAPVPVVQVTRETFHLGGAANVVHNIQALGGQATACGVIGRDPGGRRLLSELKRIGAGVGGVTTARDAITIRKTRVIAHSQQVVRFDRELHDGADNATAALVSFLQKHVWDFDAVVLSDYGKGVVTADLLAALRRLRDERSFRLIVDPKKPNFPHYDGITLATPNLSEACEAAGIEICDQASLQSAGRRLLDKWDAEAVLITRGEQGMSLFTRHAEARHFSTAARQVFDVTGAGDTVVAACALALAAGASLDQAALLANHAAGVVVGKIGTATLSPQELLRAMLAEEVSGQ